MTGIIITGTISVALFYSTFFFWRKSRVLVAQKTKLQNELSAIHKSREEFISVALFHIRAPLTAVKGYASLVIEGDYGDVDPSLKEAMNAIYLSSYRLINVVDDYLDTSRLELGEMLYDKETFNVKSVIDQVITEAKPDTDSKGLNIVFEAETPKVMMRADRPKIKQVIARILDNSIKYTLKGDIKINLKKVEGKTVKENKAIISITDNGIGIESNSFDRLFKRFSYIKNNLNAEGTGLGLYLAKEIVSHHGGTITAKSDGKGKGATFKIELPAM